PVSAKRSRGPVPPRDGGRSAEPPPRLLRSSFGSVPFVNDLSKSDGSVGAAGELAGEAPATDVPAFRGESAGVPGIGTKNKSNGRSTSSTSQTRRRGAFRSRM